MGIKGLLAFLRKLNPEIRQEVELTAMKGHKIAVDIAVKAYAYKSEYISRVAPKLDLLYEDVDYVEATNFMFHQVLKLYSNIVLAGCLPVTVFDGKPPELKDGTKKDRAAKASKKRSRIAELRRIGRALLEDPKYVPSEADIVFLKSLPVPIRTVDDIRKRLLTEIKAFISVSPDDYLRFSVILANLGMPYLFAESEAEKTCAIMARHRDVLAVLTTDSDCLVYGCPIMIEKVKYSQSATVPVPPKIYCYSFKNVLAVLELSNVQFLDFCNLCGTDFNDNSPGFGPETNLKMLKHFGSTKAIVAAQTSAKSRVELNPWAQVTAEERMILGFDYETLNHQAVIDFFIAPVTYDKNSLRLRVEDDQFERAFDTLNRLLGPDVLNRLTPLIKKLIERLHNLAKFLKVN